MMGFPGQGVVSVASLAVAGASLALASGGSPQGRSISEVWGQGAAPEIVVYVSELPRRALSELSFWDDPASPGGRLVGYPNSGDELDPPPENDPNLTFTVQVRAGVPYRCWVHMKVGAPMGVSTANVVWVQFSDAVDAAGQSTLVPRSRSYLTAKGPTREGWSWVGCDAEAGADSLVRFGTSGEVTVRIQLGMEGVGFDQVVLSPARYLERAPAEAIVPKSE